MILPLTQRHRFIFGTVWGCSFTGPDSTLGIGVMWTKAWAIVCWRCKAGYSMVELPRPSLTAAVLSACCFQLWGWRLHTDPWPLWVGLLPCQSSRSQLVGHVGYTMKGNMSEDVVHWGRFLQSRDDIGLLPNLSSSELFHFLFLSSYTHSITLSQSFSCGYGST